MNIDELKSTANEVRKGILTAVHSAKAGHPGGSLSAADIFTYLYFEEMNIDPKNPKLESRDRFVLSKGHTAPGLYSALANRGYFPVEDLPTLRHLGSYLQGHPDMKHIPGVDMSSGSLGQGISCAVGMALSGKLLNKDYRVYTLLGDGEIQEGQVWEASMFAGFKKLDNLVVIIDNNRLQIDGSVEEVCSPYPIADKFKAFNFNVIEISNHYLKIFILVVSIGINSPGLFFSSAYKLYDHLQLCAQSPKLAFLPDKYSLKKHLPEYPKHKAPCPNISISKPSGLFFIISFNCSLFNSLPRTILSAPFLCQNLQV